MSKRTSLDGRIDESNPIQSNPPRAQIQTTTALRLKLTQENIQRTHRFDQHVDDGCGQVVIHERDHAVQPVFPEERRSVLVEPRLEEEELVPVCFNVFIGSWGDWG